MARRRVAPALPPDLLEPPEVDVNCVAPGGTCVSPGACGRDEACVYGTGDARAPRPQVVPPDSAFDMPVDDDEDAPAPDERRVEAAASIAAFAKTRGGKRKGGKLRGATAAERTKAFADARARSESGEWADARATSFVALYAICHEIVYGVVAAELSQPREWAQASVAVAQFVEKEFGGDKAAAYEYFRWAWSREEGREKWRRDRGEGGSRLGWRLLFRSSYVVTDYRIARARQGSS